MSRSIAALRTMSDDELIREHDEMATHTAVGTQYYVDELHRRALERSGLEDRRLARIAVWLSVANLLAAAAAVGVSIVALLAS